MVDDRPVLRQPNIGPQTFVLARTEKEILYGGSRGGGKTDAGLARITRWIENPKLRVLVLRETYDDLVDWIDRAMQLYSSFGAVKTGQPAKIEFPSGAIIRTGYLKGQSYDKYKGHEYQKMIIEEVTQIPGEDSYEKLMGSCRSTVEDLDPQVFLTTNPDGVGRLRVKRRFVDVGPPNETYTDHAGNTRIFVPAKLQDNPVLMEKDPGYVKYLEGIKDDQLRRAWLDGDRDAYDVKGAIYSSQLNQARRENRIGHLPYEPNSEVYTARDLGMSDYTSIIFYQVIGKEVRAIDSYYNNGEPIAHYAQILREKASANGYKYKNHFFPHDADHRSKGDGKTVKDHAISAGLTGIIVIPRTPDIRADITKARTVFPMIWFDSTKCKTLVEHLEIYRQERNDKLQIFKNEPVHGPESHFADAFRAMCISLSMLVQTSKPEPVIERVKINSLTGQPMNPRNKPAGFKGRSVDRRG